MKPVQPASTERQAHPHSCTQTLSVAAGIPPALEDGILLSGVGEKVLRPTDFSRECHRARRLDSTAGETPSATFTGNSWMQRTRTPEIVSACQEASSLAGSDRMAEVLEPIEQDPLVVHTSPVVEMNDQQFFQFCQLNRDLRIERSAEGDLIIMPPAGGSSGRGNAKLTSLFEAWASHEGTGRIFDSSTGFNLPNGATRAPDVSWVSNKRLDRLSDEEWEKFLPLCPDFVLELRSRSDSLRVVKQKMEEYMQNGARLGWLLDSLRKQVFVYRPEALPELLSCPVELSGEPVLKGFILNAPQVWAAMERKK